MENLSPKDLLIERGETQKTKATTTKTKGDFNASFVLSIKFRNKVDKFDKTQGTKIKVQSAPFYLKWQNQKTEEDIYTILKKADKLAKMYDIETANLYFNLNRGWRVNAFLKSQNLELKEVQNIKLRTYNNMGNCIWTMPDNFIEALPRLIPEEVTLEKLNIYYNSIQSKSKHVSQEQAQAMYEYLKYYYLSNEAPAHPHQPAKTKEEFYNFKTKNEITEFCNQKMSEGATAETMRTFWKKQNEILIEKNKFLSMIAEEAPAPAEVKKELSKEDIEYIYYLIDVKRVSYGEICKKYKIPRWKLSEIVQQNKNSKLNDTDNNQ